MVCLTFKLTISVEFFFRFPLHHDEKKNELSNKSFHGYFFQISNTCWKSNVQIALISSLCKGRLIPSWSPFVYFIDFD